MDSFQYRFYVLKWKTLANDKERISLIREVYNRLTTKPWGESLPSVDVLAVRLLLNFFREFDTRKLPDYIPATIYAERRLNYG